MTTEKMTPKYVILLEHWRAYSIGPILMLGGAARKGPRQVFSKPQGGHRLCKGGRAPPCPILATGLAKECTKTAIKLPL